MPTAFRCLVALRAIGVGVRPFCPPDARDAPSLRPFDRASQLHYDSGVETG